MNPSRYAKTDGPCTMRHRLPTDMGTKVDTGAVEHHQRDALMLIARKGWCYWRTRSIVRWHHTVSNMEKRDYAVRPSVSYAQDWAYVLRLRSRR
jgi:hypothetical protein